MSKNKKPIQLEIGCKKNAGYSRANSLYCDGLKI